MFDVLDVIIVGAGPAGCSAALELGRRGLSVLLLERDPPDKDKPCGDAFLPDAVLQLKEYGFTDQDFKSIGGASFQHISLYNHSGLIWNHSLRNREGWLLQRKRIDQQFRNKVAKHASISYKSQVLDIERQADHRLKISFRREGKVCHLVSRAVILASGASNLFSEKWRISGAPRYSSSITTYTELDNVKSLIFQSTPYSIPGYGWIFPFREKIVNIGVCMLDEKKFSLKSSAESYLKQWGIYSKTKWRGGGGPLWSGQGKHWHHEDGLISCGDCAGLIDPVNGEGISAALTSGRRAGISVYHYLNEGLKNDALEQYSLFIDKHFQDKYIATPARKIWSTIFLR